MHGWSVIINLFGSIQQQNAEWESLMRLYETGDNPRGYAHHAMVAAQTSVRDIIHSLRREEGDLQQNAY